MIIFRFIKWLINKNINYFTTYFRNLKDIIKNCSVYEFESICIFTLILSLFSIPFQVIAFGEYYNNFEFSFIYSLISFGILALIMIIILYYKRYKEEIMETARKL